MTRLLVRGIAASLLVILGACASRHAAQGHHNSPYYSAGFDDGCTTASARATNTAGGEERDPTLYKSNKDYRSGWAAGYASCGTSNSGSPLGNPLGNPFGK
jgi:hypothetical protein